MLREGAVPDLFQLVPVASEQQRRARGQFVELGPDVLRGEEIAASGGTRKDEFEVPQ